MDAAVQTVQVPRLAIANVLIEQQRLVLGEDTDRVDIGVDAVGQREVDNTILSSKRHCGLGELIGQRVETRTAAAGQNHCDHFFCHNNFLPLHFGFRRWCTK